MQNEQLQFCLAGTRNNFSDLDQEVVKKFLKYHEENPGVFALFTRFALDLKKAGRKHYGAKAVMERIRWHFAIETVGDDFKMNNNYTSCYARLLVTTDPAFDGFFEMRRTPK